MTGRTSQFPRRNRLTRSREYASVFEKPERSSDRCFTVLFRESDLGTARLGLAISKKRLHRAVDRNRVKRIVRESFRRQAYAIGSKDIVVMARIDLRAVNNQALLESLTRHWQRLINHE